MDQKQLIHLLLLAHLAGVARGHALASRGAQGQPAQGQAQPKKPKQSQNLQGSRGAAQGRHGAKGPVMGGVGAMQNRNGQHPHQQNPTAFAMKALGGG